MLGPDGQPDLFLPGGAELLRQFEHAHGLDAEAAAGHDERWRQTVRRASDLPPGTLAGLLAKTRLPLLKLPFESAE